MPTIRRRRAPIIPLLVIGEPFQRIAMENNREVGEWVGIPVNYCYKKKDGGVWHCEHYRKLNLITKFDAYPMPWIEKLLDKIGSARFITTLDLAKVYWQVPMNSENHNKTAFIRPKGLYQFTTMPFGLSGALATSREWWMKYWVGWNQLQVLTLA